MTDLRLTNHLAPVPESDRPMDKMIAEQIMELRVSHDPVWQKTYEAIDDLVVTTRDGQLRSTLPFYCAHMGHAWEVVEKLSSRFGFSLAGVGPKWVATFSERLVVKKNAVSAGAPYPALAICLAAIKVRQAESGLVLPS